MSRRKFRRRQLADYRSGGNFPRSSWLTKSSALELLSSAAADFPEPLAHVANAALDPSVLGLTVNVLSGLLAEEVSAPTTDA
ncbi:hypothetical protein HPB52_011646 [Rhipicephalus sanguineus]|uniref:Uncharacterized protein n=1 Tax=Rhipicephalus sanguineus TaxID=34632 RepID=A0A9D4PTZ8_RHISA|nr:hypothetical protein HPB52_011646 [Rhipicephalus sanguineus]